MSDVKNSSYLQYLPAIYTETEFLGQFLNIFEKIFTGIVDHVVIEPFKLTKRSLQKLQEANLKVKAEQRIPESVLNSLKGLENKEFLTKEELFKEMKISLSEEVKKQITKEHKELILQYTQKYPGIEHLLYEISAYVDPSQAPEEFLDWLAGWVALDLQADWDEPTRRKLIARMIPLYQRRGTKDGMMEFLNIYLGTEGNIPIDESDRYPYHFTVTISKSSLAGKTQENIEAIIDFEKPAHTTYELILN